MPRQSLVRAFLSLYVTLGLVVLIQSVQTVVAAHSGSITPGDRRHALVLGALEALAAVAFLIPRTMRVGAVALLVIFAAAFALHALGGDWHLPLLVYGAGALFVQVHGVRG